MIDYGPNVASDDPYKRKARLHQSRYRAEVLQVEYLNYGSRLTDRDGENLLNYYDKLNVREILKTRYPKFKPGRDSNLLRSEHIPFNCFAPLISDQSTTLKILHEAFKISLSRIDDFQIEFAPSPKGEYLNDDTSFDTYISGSSQDGRTIGIGIEVKYTERGYSIGEREKQSLGNPDSPYWTVADKSGVFTDPRDKTVTKNALRQVWRNHLLGLSMIQHPDVDEFYSVTLFPEGNRHFHEVLPKYRELLKPDQRQYLIGCTFEDFITAIPEEEPYANWKRYLYRRYIVQ
jgi:hypothetical protein